MRAGSACAEQRLDAAANVIERPGVDPRHALVERNLAVTYDDKLRPEQRARPMQHGLERVARFVTVGVRPQDRRDARRIDVAGAERGDESQEIEEALWRFPCKRDGRAIA